MKLQFVPTYKRLCSDEEVVRSDPTEFLIFGKKIVQLAKLDEFKKLKSGKSPPIRYEISFSK